MNPLTVIKITTEKKREIDIGPSRSDDGLQSLFRFLGFFESAEKKAKAFFAQTVQTAIVRSEAFPFVFLRGFSV